MNTAAFYHKANDNYCYALNDRQLVIRVRTGYDVKSAALWHGDPFAWGIMGGSERWCGERVEITDVVLLREHKLWTVVVEPEFRRCRYYFEFSDGADTIFFTENGVLSRQELEEDEAGKLDFYFPWMNPSDIYTPPSWVTDTVWYQIFPDRFCRGGSREGGPEVLKWAGPDCPVQNDQVYGGNLAGIESKLDYLKDLGIGGIYLTPVNEGSSVHKYDTTDYYKIDPSFGNEEDMKRLVESAHENGIRVMLDGVFNHCGAVYPKWLEVKEKGPASPYYDWFMVREWPFEGKGRDARERRFYSFAFADDMPKLNTNHPKVQQELLNICTYWVEEYGIDALRLDVANEISHTFCKALRGRMLSLKPDFYIVGEIWHDSMPWLRGDEFDSVMNYPLRQVITGLGVSPHMDSRKFEQEINRCYTMYPMQNNRVLFNLLDSHDTIRLRTRLEDQRLFALQLAVLFTMTGSACIYYGTETALAGGHDPDCRRTMPWREMEQGHYAQDLRLIRDLTAMRGRYGALRYGECRFISREESPFVIRYRKEASGEITVEVTLNLSGEPLYTEHARLEGAEEGKRILSGNYDPETGCLYPSGYLIEEVPDILEAKNC